MKKGFTLIEVIGVLILLAAIALIAVPSIEQQIKEGKQKLYDSQITAIKLDTQNWLSDNLIYKPNNGEVITIMLAQLKQGGYVDTNVTNPITKELFPNDMLITITNNDGIITYDVLTNTGSDKTIYDSDTPLIILSGNVITNVELNSTYTDLGATASVNGKNITDHITTTGSVNTSTIGSYSITYSVNYNNKTNYFIRTVNVVDRVAPVITVPSTEISIPDNELVNTSVLNDVTVTDNSGAYTLNIKSDLSTIAGVYTVTYEATDASGNKSTQTRKVTVIKSGNPIFVFGKMTVTINEGDTYDLMTSVNAIDANGYNISNVTCSINGSTCDTTSLVSGTYTVNYIATDSNGHSTTASRTLKVNFSFAVDTSGANNPVLYNNMIPVYYDGTNWVYSDGTQKNWYNYNDKYWANAVVLVSSPSKTYSVGDIIAMSDISQMYVWIPRYKYTIFNGNNGSAVAQEINVAFENGANSTGTVSCTDAVAGSGSSSETCTDSTNGSVTNGTSTYTHPAFKFGTTSLTGLWIGKFEISGTTDAITIKPNITSLRSKALSSFFTAISNISTQKSINTDSHMMKNMEWGAVAYLEASKYGLETTDIGINNNSSFITGCGAPSGNASNTTCNSYDTTNGKLASTTGNIYGIYDMSGGAYEYVMGDMVTSSNVPMVGYNSSNNSGFNGTMYDGTWSTGVNLPNSKYYDLYTYGTSNVTHNRGKLGDATKETLVTYGNGVGGWYSDFSFFLHLNVSWFVRGGRYDETSVAGVFYFNYSNGNAGINASARVVLTGID